jgi:hypothetical protein
MLNASKLTHFVGKVCTVFTVPTNRNYKEENPTTFQEQILNYFVGVVESADSDGVMLAQINGERKSFFFAEHIVAIAEEDVLDPSDEGDAQVIEELRQAKEAEKKAVEEEMKEQDNVEVLEDDGDVDGPYLDPQALLNFSKQLSQQKT